MAAPVFVAEYETAWNADTTPKATNVTTAVGDVLVLIGMIENGLASLNTPTGGTGLTWTLQQSIPLGSDWCAVYVWTATAATAETFSCSVTRGGSTGAWWGWIGMRWSGSDGVGASSKTNVSSGAPSLGLTTTAANSAICLGSTDWTASDGASRVWRTVNGSAATEQAYFRNSSRYTLYAGRHADAGTAGAKTVGLGAPSGQKYSLAAVEVLGSAGSTTTGTLDATAPLVTGDISGTVRVTGTLSGTAPDITADIAGTVTVTGTMAGVAPVGTASITGDVVGIVTGSLDATAPLPTADITGAVTVGGTLDTTSPLPLASIGGTVAAPDADRVTPWTLAVAVDWQTLTVSAPSRTLTLDAPEPRALDLATPPPRTLELDAPAQTLTLTTPGWTLEVEV